MTLTYPIGSTVFITILDKKGIITGLTLRGENAETVIYLISHEMSGEMVERSFREFEFTTQEKKKEIRAFQ
jgi:hypothetical protein